MSPEDWTRWVDLNLTSTFLMCKAAIPLMAESGGGSIVNVSSGAGVTGMMKNPAYVAAKGGVIALTRSLAIDHADQHIRANCVAPGPILTPLMERNRRPEEIDFLARMTLAGRIGVPHDIAATIAFLSSKDGEFINGELINVAGGRRVAPAAGGWPPAGCHAALPGCVPSVARPRSAGPGRRARCRSCH